MGVLVHAIRLNTLEFSNHIEMQWAGIKYRPFAKNTKTDIQKQIE
jgi:V/A-type H+-transporting ATPase subunit I